MTALEVKEAISGKDGNGKSKAVSIIGTHINDIANLTKDPEVIMEVTSMEPSVELRFHGNMATVDLEFSSEKSEQLKMFFRCLERFLEETDNNSERQEASCFINLIPYSLSGQYYVTAINPIFWSLTPDFAGGNFNKLRIVFYANNVIFNESNSEENVLDAAMLQAEDKKEDDKNDELYNYIDETDYLDDDEKEDRNEKFSNSEKYSHEIKKEYNDDPYAE